VAAGTGARRPPPRGAVKNLRTGGAADAQRAPGIDPRGRRRGPPSTSGARAPQPPARARRWTAGALFRGPLASLEAAVAAGKGPAPTAASVGSLHTGGAAKPRGRQRVSSVLSVLGVSKNLKSGYQCVTTNEASQMNAPRTWTDLST